MKNKKIRKIVNEAIGFIHLTSDGTVSQKEGKTVINRLRKVKYCDLQNVNQQREQYFNFITWYNAKPFAQKPKDGLITTTIIEEFLKL